MAIRGCDYMAGRPSDVEISTKVPSGDDRREYWVNNDRKQGGEKKEKLASVVWMSHGDIDRLINVAGYIDS